MEGEMQYKFVNAAHEKAYHDAKALLTSEDERQAREGARLMTEWEHYPNDLRREKIAWLNRHWHECRAPYIKLLGDILALASPIIIMPALEQKGTEEP